MADVLPSSEERPASDPFDAAVKSLSSRCREIVQLSHQLDDAYTRLDRAKCATPIDADDLADAAAAFGRLEERFYNLREDIEREARHYQQDLHMRFLLVHTDTGMPIRVNTSSRKAPWT